MKHKERVTVSIQNVATKERIRRQFGSSKGWQKEYIYEWDDRTGWCVETHRFVNTRNRKESFGEKVKRSRMMDSDEWSRFVRSLHKPNRPDKPRC